MTEQEAGCAGGTLHIRLVVEGAFMTGPGKADLLAMIRETGSIPAVGRRAGVECHPVAGTVSVAPDDVGHAAPGPTT
ncbi:MAG: hypothetical protein RI571_11180 [Roseovarius sp.]|nr:hypothetical protein [Roseovarius sp.]